MKKKDIQNQQPMPSVIFGEEMDFSATEAYNLLRSSLGFACAKRKGIGRAIGVTSANPHDGKSFTSVNLALALARTGEKVLLIDGDMRCPRIMEYTGLALAPGLSNLLADVDCDNLAPYLQKIGEIENLSVITAGDIPPNPAELIGSERMDEVLTKTREMFDTVILDLPPVLMVPDAFTVSKYLEGEILVVKHKQSLKKNVLDAVRQLKFAGTHILGFVYNGYSRGSGYYSKNRYYRSYGKRYAKSYAKAYEKSFQKNESQGAVEKTQK